MLLLLLQTTSTTPQANYIQPWVGNLAAWVALGFLGLIGVAILYNVFTGKIDLSGLISEPNGDASMSRFQLLVFTFVIAASLYIARREARLAREHRANVTRTIAEPPA